MVFRKVDAKRLIQASRSQTGHQLLPRTDDLFASSMQANRAIPSLRWLKDLGRTSVHDQAWVGLSISHGNFPFLILYSLSRVREPELARTFHVMNLAAHRAQSKAQPLYILFGPLAHMSLMNLKKSALQSMLKNLGEDPPDRWTKLELKQRILELKPKATF